MEQLTETEIAVLRWYAHTSEPIADAFAGDVLESRIRLSRLGLVSHSYSTCDDRVAERASESGLIVLSLLDQVAELKRERDKALAKLEEEKRERARAGFSRGED